VFRLHAPGGDDADAVLDVLAARDRHDFGSPHMTRDLLVAQWRLGQFDPGRDSIVAEEGGRVVGYAALFPLGALAFVDPDHEGKGIGTGLLAWSEARATYVGRDLLRQRVAESNSAGRALLKDAGYAQVRTVWQMVGNLEAGTSAAAPPPGVVLRPLELDGDAAVIHRVDAEAFAEDADYQPETFEDFQAQHLAGPELDRAASIVACRGETIVGFSLCSRCADGSGYVDVLAVLPAERRRGLGTALLESSFAAFARAGRHAALLDVSSANPGARALYERAGMRPRNPLEVYEKPVATAAA
jgi:mycothiol synthase